MASPGGNRAQRGSESQIYSSSASLWTRLIYYLKLRFIKTLLPIFATITRLPGIRNIEILPTFTKVYPAQKRFKNRVFIPKSYKSGDPLLPLYIDIHGGGFCLGHNALDDSFCAHFAHEKKILVVSLDYPKAPESPYPGAVRVLTDLVRAVLDDETLPFDKKKVAIGGFSAGANLALAVCQTFQGEIGGAVAFYGVMDFTTTTPEKYVSPNHPARLCLIIPSIVNLHYPCILRWAGYSYSAWINGEVSIAKL